MYPRIRIEKNKVRENLREVATKVRERGNASLAVVTKCVCADPEIVNLIIENDGVEYIADSRIENIASYADLVHETGKSTMFLRIPMKSELEEVVRLVDVCQISELDTIKALNETAQRSNKVQKILLMIDLGDLREGIFYENREEIKDTVSEILKLENIELCGLSVNLSCYGGILPTEENLGTLGEIARNLEEEFFIKLKMVSGGATSSLYLIDQGKFPESINNLRIGEAFIVGYDSSGNQRVPGTSDDAFILEAEIVEIKDKPSVPIGEVGRDAFGNIPEFQDRGIMKRAIVAVGKQDVPVDKLVPLDEDIEIMGGSSDHTILNLTSCKKEYRVGDIIEFKLNYGALLMATTSKYIGRVYMN